MIASSTTPPAGPSARAIRRRRAVTAAAGALAAGLTTLAGATSASAATPANTVCPSSACQKIAAGFEPAIDAVADAAGHAYLPTANGDLLKVDLATGAVTTVATGLGNLRGVALDGSGNAYVTGFEGTLQKVVLATGAHTLIATEPSPLIGIARAAGATYVTDGAGALIQITDGQAPRVVSTGIGLSESVALDGKGNAYTGDMFTDEIQRTNLSSGATTTVASEDYEPTSVSVGPDGMVYFNIASQVTRLNPATGATTLVTEIGLNPGDFTMAADGDAYALDLNGAGTLDTLWKITDLTN